MQHLYWRYLEPERFKLALDPKKEREYETSILEGYRAMDRLLGRMLALIGEQAIVILSPP